MEDPALQVISDAAGRMRVSVGWVRADSRRAVAVEEAVAKCDGVRVVHAYPRTGSVVIWYSPRRCDRSAVLAAIGEAAHVAAELIPARAPHSSEIRNADVLRMVIGGAALALLGVRRYVFARPPLLGPSGRLFATGVTVFTGYPFLRGALRSLRSGRAGTDALVSAATVASLVLRENVVALTVLWLLNIGEYLQDLTLRRTRRAISELLRGSQDTAWIRLEHNEIQVATDTLQIGDEVVVHDHVAIPVDGEVIDGEAIVDQSAITGENLPVSVVVGMPVHAGSVVVRGRLVVRARAVGNQTTIGRIITRVEEAQHDRAPIQTVGENFSRRFVPTSFIVSAITLAVTGDVRRAMTMLLIACPCAVGLATPTAISAAIGNGARRGILIKGGSHLEQAGQVDAIVFDKTGTLTVGRPVVTNIVAMHKDWEPEQVLAYAASSEIHSRHPLAEAVIRSTEERHITIPPHEECEVLVGLGMRTWADGRTLLLGSPSLLQAEKVKVSKKAKEWVDKLRRQAETPLLLAVDGTLVGLISLRDEVRPEAAGVLKKLRANGIRRIVMLTGDHPDIAAVVADELGIDEWRAEVMPEDKLAAVRDLQEEGFVVGMVGDGINDAPALAAADIGIAMGLAGTDVAVETADVALSNDDLHRLLDVRDLGSRAVDVIRENYGMSIAVNAAGLIIGAGGALSPVLAAILHNASSVAVVANSSRLIRYRLN
ncbi:MULTISPECIES: manganese-exporting P-type ATPase CtpC [Mycobacterium avium complex (MAC)]|jgi:cation-transporting P-type ATPase C|uniref:Copper-translocating P-type ATPase n=2 Tax=Mycobacterium avium complex (MAC) TaxID=120793 RepID=A0ABX3TSM4_9MYCO|nr:MULTISPECIES: manganese-exporting P-type ATPase CtpC [Mycobacterium avium complex (MAC)]ETB32615.1 cation-transporting ATPase [Mycobacterium avium subsp. hominissuis 10-4249]TXA40233.1 copper-translocating P-type ATPase [Mycobacterium tuberculosis variant bovis]ABK68773.1 cadmium-translocating P-type ATPase [Mycobacterium avium 104]ATO64114.2 manganese-exporting P-type ATPase CtpC [Mycobacterium avium subsp. hominissuis]ATO68670.1 manganese-exporting P-type ATPase CtpC [Mycobacterium avium 